MAVLSTTLLHLYVLPLATFPCEFRLAYIGLRNVSYAYSVFRKTRTYVNVFYFSVRVSSSHVRINKVA